MTSPRTATPRDPVVLLEAHAETMYEAWRKEHPRDPFGNTTERWAKLCPNDREIWRGKALVSLRSQESVLDELKREDRERRRLVSVLRDSPENGSGGNP